MDKTKMVAGPGRWLGGAPLQRKSTFTTQGHPNSQRSTHGSGHFGVGYIRRRACPHHLKILDVAHAASFGLAPGLVGTSKLPGRWDYDGLLWGPCLVLSQAGHLRPT